MLGLLKKIRRIDPASHYGCRERESVTFEKDAEIFLSFAASFQKFLDPSDVLVWGIVPAGFEIFQKS
jgi:hypothetical protein